jgi:hypothetical protein
MITAFLVWQLILALQPTSARYDTHEAMAGFAAFTDRVFFGLLAVSSLVLTIGLWSKWAWAVWLSLLSDALAVALLTWWLEVAGSLTAVLFVLDGLLLVRWLRHPAVPQTETPTSGESP